MIGPVYGHKSEHLRDMHPEFLDEEARKLSKKK